MEHLIIQGKADTYFIPSINFDADTGKLVISGESYLEDTRAFYVKLIQWIEQFIREKNIPVTLDIKLSYYNTSSSKSLLEIFYTLKEYKDNGGEVVVNWYYSKDDVEIEEEVEDFQIESGLNINMIPIEE